MPYRIKGSHYKIIPVYGWTDMQTLVGTKSNIQRPQNNSLLKVLVCDRTEWLDSQLVWPSWLVYEIFVIFRPRSGRLGKTVPKIHLVLTLGHAIRLKALVSPYTAKLKAATSLYTLNFQEKISLLTNFNDL